MIILPCLLLLSKAEPYYGSLGYAGLGYRHYQSPSSYAYTHPPSPAASYRYLPRLTYNYHTAPQAPVAPTLASSATPTPAVRVFAPADRGVAPAAVRRVGLAVEDRYAPAVEGVGPAVGRLGPAVGGVGPAVEGVGPAVGGDAAHSVAAVADVSHLTSPVASQYHAQDEEGNYSFGYNNPVSARMETGSPLTGVRG